MNLETTIHADGTATYWSVYQQRWVTDHITRIPDKELAAMRHDERQRVIAAMEPTHCDECGAAWTGSELRQCTVCGYTGEALICSGCGASRHYPDDCSCTAG